MLISTYNKKSVKSYIEKLGLEFEIPEAHRKN